MTSAAFATSLASSTSTALFHQKNSLNLMVGSFLAPKWPILVPFCGMYLQKFNFSLMSFLLEAAEARWCYFFKNWLKKHKWASLETVWPEIDYQNPQSFYPSELFTLDNFFMKHPVCNPIWEYFAIRLGRLSFQKQVIVDCYSFSLNTLKWRRKSWNAFWSLLKPFSCN